MKSLMQEASSLIKAIEKAWENAGKPKEFSIKVFEEPKKNFIGMTVQSAKIGIFFDEKSPLKKIEKEEIKKREQVSAKNISSAQVKQYDQPQASEKNKPQQRSASAQPAPKRERVVEQRPQQPQQHHAQKEVWTQEMVDMVSAWLKGMLERLNCQHVTFSLQPSAYQLNVTFNTAINKTPEKDQQLMRSFALLLMQTLRHSLKRPLRGFKIMLTAKSS